MLPYLIAGAIGFGIGKLFENGGETFMAGGRITTNEDILRSFLTSSKEVKVNNLSTHFNESTNLLLLRNYGTIIAGRYVNNNENDYRYGTLNFCYVTKTKYSQTTTKIVNKLKALATKMGYTITDACTFDDGGETKKELEEGYDVDYGTYTDSEGWTYNSLRKEPIAFVYREIDDPNVLPERFTPEEVIEFIGNFNQDFDTNYKDWQEFNKGEEYRKFQPIMLLERKFENGGETFMAGGTTNEDIIFEYPKDSNGRIMRWINVGKGNDEIASKTGTIGTVRAGHQLIVLQSETPNKVDYHILVDYLPEENKINMVRGKANSEPSPKYQSYINDLFRMLRISQKTRDYQDEDIANQVYVKKYLIDNFGNPPKGCEIKAKDLGVEIHFDSTNQMANNWAMKIADKYGYPNGNFEMRYSSGSVPILFIDRSKIAKNTSKSGKGFINFGETFMAGGKADSGVGEYKMYKLRAEGLNDFINFLGTGIYFNVKSFTVEPIGVPDVVVSFESNLSLSELKSKLRKVQDSHVMLDTIKPIEEYTGERYAVGGGLPKKRRRSASMQYGTSDRAFDKQLTAKPVGYRFTNAKANQLRKDPFAKPTEAQVKKYLGKGIYKENRRNRSDRDRNAKL